MDARRIHEFDQSTGASGEWAMKLAAFHGALMRSGFTRAESLEIVKDYQIEVIRSIEDWSASRG